MIKINCWEDIRSYPRAQIAERFGNVNLCVVDINQYRLEILFGPGGELLTKQSLIKQISTYFNKRYIPVSIGDELGYACIVQKHTPKYRG